MTQWQKRCWKIGSSKNSRTRLFQ